MVARNSIVAEVARRLDDRRLVWVGIRTDDLEPLADIPQLSASFCLIGSTAHRGGIETTTYEDLTGERMDPETVRLNAATSKQPSARIFAIRRA